MASPLVEDMDTATEEYMEDNPSEVLNDDIQQEEETVEDSNEAPEPVDNAEQPEEKSEKLVKFPLGRVKHIMKMDPDVKMASQDAAFLVTKATELFVESLARECYSYTVQAKKKTLQKNDVDKAIDSIECLAFLEGALED